MVVLSGSSLDSSLRAWVMDARPDWPTERVDLVLRTLGWVGDVRPSLSEVGHTLGITRQSAHEMIHRLLDSLPPPELGLSEYLEEATSLIQGLDLPMHAEAVTDALEAKLGPLTPSAENVLSICAAAGLEAGLRVEAGYVLKRGQRPPEADGLETQVSNYLRLHGFFDIRDLGQEIQLPSGISVADAVQVLAASANVRRIEGDYFISTADGSGGRLVSNTRKMLVVTSPMRLLQLAAGLDRQTRAGRMPSIPEGSTLALILRAFGFSVVEDFVDLREPLDAEATLSSTEHLLYRWLDSGDMRTSQLKRMASEAGIPARTLVHYLSYSPIIESRGRGEWGLRGRKVERPRSAPSPQVSYTWSTDGKLVLRVLVGGGDGVVVHIPESVLPMLNDRSFKTAARSTISIRDGRFVLESDQYSNRGVGDWLALSFDLAQGSLVLQ